MKKVIFIGGTAYSGSTFFDMILANDPAGFSCGEVIALFHPYRKHHINPDCGCMDKRCTIWAEVLKNGKRNLYHTIFDMFPNIEFIVDSSKNPFWIKQQKNNLRKKHVDYKDVLIWKTPLEFAQSSYKRGRDIRRSSTGWLNYHRLYFSLMEDFLSVKYHDLIKVKSTLEQVCEYLGIPSFEGKERYWEKQHHTLFGSTSAKIHLRSQNSKEFNEEKEILERHRKVNVEESLKSLKTIYYNEVIDNDIVKQVKEVMDKQKLFSLIEEKLNSYDFANQKKGKTYVGSVIMDIEFSRIYLTFKFLRHKMKEAKSQIYKWKKLNSDTKDDKRTKNKK